MRGRDTPSPGCLSPAAAMCGGLFRYIQPTGAVRDLHVSGTISPSDRKNTLGGLVGENQGTITNCSFSGTVSGADSIGGIAGINEAQGQLINCTFSGSVTGEHYVGGIAGQNYGSIIQCENSGSINTTEVDAELNLDNLNQEQLNAAENVPVCTDIGGITGFPPASCRAASTPERWDTPMWGTTSAASWGGSPAI